jgi:hypothetical protein
MERCAAMASALHCCSEIMPSMSAQTCTAHLDSRDGRPVVVSMQRPSHSRERKRKWARASNQDVRLNRQDKSTVAWRRLSHCLHIQELSLSAHLSSPRSAQAPLEASVLCRLCARGPTIYQLREAASILRARKFSGARNFGLAETTKRLKARTTAAMNALSCLFGPRGGPAGWLPGELQPARCAA